jgi:hypothetical protein
MSRGTARAIAEANSTGAGASTAGIVVVVVGGTAAATVATSAFRGRAATASAVTGVVGATAVGGDDADFGVGGARFSGVSALPMP